MTNRQEEILIKIIEVYIEKGNPIGSKYLIKKYKLSISPATMRNDMSILEHEGYLEKAHTSSGRIPSIKGFKFYAYAQDNNEDTSLSLKLKKIFKNRSLLIDTTLDKAAKAISEITNLTLVTSSSKKDDKMKSIQLTPINDQLGTIVIVTSSGDVYSKLIEFNEIVKISDVRIAIRIFKERLVDSKLRDLPRKAELLVPILSAVVKNYEGVIKEFVTKVFDFHIEVRNNVYGNHDLIKRGDIKREDLAELIKFIETESVWESIEQGADEDQTIKIDIRPNNTSLISKKIQIKNEVKEISIIGSNRIDYPRAKQVIKLLENLFSNKKGGID